MSRKYGHIDKISEDKARCIKEVFNGYHHYQCQRKRGHGKDGLWCKQHDPERIREKERQAQQKYDDRRKRWKENTKRQELITKLCGDIPTNELHKYRLVLLAKSEL